ncbi:MAG: DNA polymerase III subunit gamma and tau, partial [Demequina sp.]
DSAAPAASRDIAGGPEDTELVRRRWSEVLGTLEKRRVTWAMVSQSAQVASIEQGVLTLSFDNAALAGRFNGGAHAENVGLAVRETLGLHVRVEGTEGPGHTPAAAQAPSPTTAPASSDTTSPDRSSGAAAGPLPSTHEPPDEDVSDDDDSTPDSQLAGADVVAQMLGGTVVKE